LKAKLQLAVKLKNRFYFRRSGSVSCPSWIRTNIVRTKN
jgi:hypothetical protein